MQQRAVAYFGVSLVRCGAGTRAPPPRRRPREKKSVSARMLDYALASFILDIGGGGGGYLRVLLFCARPRETPLTLSVFYGYLCRVRLIGRNVLEIMVLRIKHERAADAARRERKGGGGQNTNKQTNVYRLTERRVPRRLVTRIKEVN